jgi:hypothetical protein
MIHKNIWKPDTCDCQIEYEWDDSQSEAVRTHTCSRVIKACSYHEKYPDKNENYSVVVDENRRKNLLYKHIIDNVSGAVDEKIQSDGSAVKELKKGLEYKWSFDEDRNLVVDLAGFSAAQKNEIKTLASNNFGEKVKIK